MQINHIAHSHTDMITLKDVFITQQHLQKITSSQQNPFTEYKFC